VAVIAAGPQAAGGASFVAFLLAPAGQAILAQHGFGRP
jgi:molybdate transport system substrate-binding protein